MTSLELYYEFHLLFNKNASYANIDVSKGNFVILYNRELLRWLNDFIKLNNSFETIHGIQGLLEVDEKLELINKEESFYSFMLPTSFFRFVDCTSVVERDGCKTKISNYLNNPKDTKAIIENVIPSFDFEESLCNIAQEKVLVSLGDYKINDTYLSYYKKPIQIDITGYRKVDGTMSQNIDSDLDDIYQSEVINRTVLEVMRQFENGNGYKLSSDRLLLS